MSLKAFRSVVITGLGTAVLKITRFTHIIKLIKRLTFQEGEEVMVEGL